MYLHPQRRGLCPPLTDTSASSAPLSARPLLAALVLAAVMSTPADAAVVLAPQLAGDFATRSGADATFVQIDSSWRGSSVLWNEALRSFGSGEAIGSRGWGTGLWGRADFESAQAAAAGRGQGSSPRVVEQWTGTVPVINFANDLYNDLYSGTWGQAELVPLFQKGEGAGAQQNWTARFSGFIRITDPGAYNFSVLNDDGFFFRLVGADGETADIGRDFLNPRDRNGFGDDLLLDVGLYGFELGFWNRLEAGVVDLRWQTPGSSDWTLVPTSSLSPADYALRQVPAPPSLMLAALGVALLGAGWRRKTRAPSPPEAG